MVDPAFVRYSNHVDSNSPSPSLNREFPSVFSELAASLKAPEPLPGPEIQFIVESGLEPAETQHVLSCAGIASRERMAPVRGKEVPTGIIWVANAELQREANRIIDEYMQKNN
jgi:hypothetical protein